MNLDIRQEAHDAYLNGIHPTDGKKPNIVLIFVDDMGYGDISCFGSRAIKTPNLDRLAEEGAKLTNFYAASPVCSPSRFACLTGRYPTRSFFHNVLFPEGTDFGRHFNARLFPEGMRGILPDEITLAEALRAGGYATAIFGKWHLGDCSPYLPNEHGFDYFFGALYSVDMEPYELYRNEEVAVASPVDKRNLTKILTSEIEAYLDTQGNKPFFLYYASPYPHHPAAASEEFTGKSLGGTYGDCVEELDWSVGRIMEKLKERGIEKDTLIVFSSDNGPWFEGNPGYHRGRKGTNYDGGHMVPFIARWPERIRPGTVIENPAMNTDFFPTFLNMAGIDLPRDREIDGVDILPLLIGESTENPHDRLLFIAADKVQAIRTKDDKKYMVKDKCEYQPYIYNDMGPFLFDMRSDPQESYDTTVRDPKKAKEMQRMIDEENEKIKSNPRGWK